MISKPEKVKSEHTAPTPGLNNVVFTFGSTKDAAEFAKTKSKLSRYIGTQTWHYASEAALAMETMLAPVYVEPATPVREYESSTDSTGAVTIALPRVPLIDDYIFKLDCEEFSSNKKLWKAKEAAWKEQGEDVQPCVAALPSQARGSPQDAHKMGCGPARARHNPTPWNVRDVTHKHDETKQGTMALVESFLEFATTFQETGQTVDAYSTLF